MNARHQDADAVQSCVLHPLSGACTCLLVSDSLRGFGIHSPERQKGLGRAELQHKVCHSYISKIGIDISTASVRSRRLDPYGPYLTCASRNELLTFSKLISDFRRGLGAAPCEVFCETHFGVGPSFARLLLPKLGTVIPTILTPLPRTLMNLLV
jgi:hypothetical protein